MQSSRGWVFAPATAAMVARQPETSAAAVPELPAPVAARAESALQSEDVRSELAAAAELAARQTPRADTREETVRSENAQQTTHTEARAWAERFARDEAAMAEAIQRCLMVSPDKDRIVESSLPFTWKRTVETYWDVLESALA